MRTYRAWRISVIAFGCTVALGCSAVAQTMTKVTVGSATVTTTPLGATYSSLPIALFWKQEGLDVKYVGLPGANAALQALIAGTVDVVPGTNSALFAMYQKYPDAKVVSFFTHTTAFNSVPVVLKDSALKTIRDLEGKNVGVQSLANSQVPVTKALVTLEGGDAGKLKFIAVGEGPEAAHALVAKRVDSLALFDGLYASIEAAGTPLHELTTHALNRDRLGFNAALWARSDYIKDRRDVLVRLGRGVAKSVVFAKANPEAAIRVHWEVFPATKPRGVSDADAMRQSLANLNARLRNIDIVEGLVGNSTTPQIHGYMDLMVTGGMLDARLPLDKFWDAGLLKDINDFDRDAVSKQAQDWKG